MYDWVAMQAFIDAGNGYVACHKKFGIAHATWMKAIRSGDIVIETTGKPYADARKRIDWVAVQNYYDTGASVRRCMAHFGFSSASWTKAVRRGDVTSRSLAFTLDQAMKSTSRWTVKRYLLRAGILKNRCDWCGLDSWRGLPISIQIDHINGKGDDHRVENLRMLCPNCHSQTETYGGKNLKSNGIPGSSNGRTASSDVAYRGSSP